MQGESLDYVQQDNDLIIFKRHGTANKYQLAICQEAWSNDDDQYFEVEIVDKIQCGVVAIGITHKDTFYAKTLPGWRKLSFGWHSDSDLFWSAQGVDTFDTVKQEFGKGDRVGLGIYQRQVYLTRNGKLLGMVLSLDQVRKEMEQEHEKAKLKAKDPLSDDEQQALLFNETYEYIPGVGIVSFSKMLPQKRLHIREKVGEKLSETIINRYCNPPPLNNINEKSPDLLSFYPVVCSDSPATIRLLGIQTTPSSFIEEMKGRTVDDYKSEHIAQEKRKLDEDEQELLSAVQDLNPQKVKELLQDKYIDVNIGTADGKSLMDIAFSTYVRTLNRQYLDPTLEIADILKLRGATINLFDAALIGDLDRVKQCIDDEQMYINVQNNAGKSALHRAILGNHLDVVKYLLEKGAYVDVTDPTTTALTIAVMKGLDSVVKVLIEHGANVHVKHGRQNLLQLVVRSHFQSSAVSDAAKNIVELLVTNGCDPFYSDKSTEAVDLLLAERPAIYHSIVTENLWLFTKLIQNTSNIEDNVTSYRGMVGESLLDEIILCYNGKNSGVLLSMSQLLFDIVPIQQPLLSMKTEYGETCIHYIAATNFFPLFTYLLQMDSFDQKLLQESDIYGFSPFDYATGNSSEQMTKQLKPFQTSINEAVEQNRTIKYTDNHLSLRRIREVRRSGG